MSTRRTKQTPRRAPRPRSGSAAAAAAAADSAAEPTAPAAPAADAQHRSGRLDDLPDGQIVALCIDGQEAAWEVLVRRFRRLIYAIPMRAGLEPEEADEVFQLTFARLVEHLDSLREPERVRAWLVTTARRLTLDATRRQRRFEDGEHVLEQLPDTADLPPRELERLEVQHLVRTALARLGERCRRLLELLYCYTQDRRPPYEAISAQLGMPVGSIGPTRARCLEKLQEEYRKLEDDPM